MKLKLPKRNKPKSQRITAVQTARGVSHPFEYLERYVPLATPEQKMYDALREAIPIIDAAIDKIVRLTGTFKVKCKSKETQKMLEEFLSTVKVSASSTGIDAFITQYLDRLLTWGTTVAEIVPYTSGEVGAIYCANNDDIRLIKGENPLEITICRADDGNNLPIPHPERILISALKPMPGEIRGVSLLRGLPFVSEILLKIYNSIGTNWERIGNLRYAVTYKPSGSFIENTLGTDAIQEISQEWSHAMNSDGNVKDFVAVGDVDIKVIGSDNQILNSEVPVKQMLEEIVAKLGVPPFILGLSWSSTERMSQQQADILTSELESYRLILSPVLKKICEYQLRAFGYCDKVEILWDDINLQDELETSKAQLLKTQAESINQQKKGD